MLVLVQWTSDPPQDWVEIEHRDWPHQPEAPLHALNVQGVIFEGFDHYAVGSVTGGCTVTAWNDEGADGDLPMRWTFYDPAPDPALGGRLNTRQQLEVFGDHPLQNERTTMGKVRRRTRFVAPAHPRHGKQVSDALHAAHQQIRSHCSWERWA